MVTADDLDKHVLRRVTVDDLDKYVLEQAKIEVEHTRSWPTKILAFYLATNVAIVTGLFTLAGRTARSVVATSGARTVLAGAVCALAVWALILLGRNHCSYLRYRNLQIRFQKANAFQLNQRYSTSSDWLQENAVDLHTRWVGWGFYALLVVVITVLSLAGICVA